MDIDTAQDMIINWIGQAPWDLKYEFMRSLFGAVQENEEQATRKVAKPRVESAPVEPAPPKQKAWYQKYEKDEIVALDCEHVHYIDEKGRKRIKAATVSIVNYSGKEIYSAKIYHPKNSFIVNWHTKRITGFTATTFDDPNTCKRIEIVKDEVNEHLANKLIITHSGAIDFESLKLNAGDYDHYDIAEYFKRPKLNKFGEDVGEKISLRSLCAHFFDEDIQSGPHSPFMDARATMKMFRKAYIPSNQNTEDRFYTNFSLFDNVPKFQPAK